MSRIDKILNSGKLFRTEYHDGKGFTYRLLTLKEYSAYRSLIDSGRELPIQVWVDVFKRCLVGDPALLSGRVPLGMYANIGQLIMWLSGDSAGETIKNDIIVARSMYDAESVLEHMKRTIWAAFPSYKIEDLEDWTRIQVLERFAVAEAVLITRIPEYKPLDVSEIVTAGEAQQTEQKQTMQRVDMAMENNEIIQNTSSWERQEAMDKMASNKLSAKQARALDRRRR